MSRYKAYVYGYIDLKGARLRRSSGVEGVYDDIDADDIDEAVELAQSMARVDADGELVITRVDVRLVD